MKSLYFLFCLAWVFDVPAQGTFLFHNTGARTRIGTIDGPYAGENILAQMLVGANSTSLTPVGYATNHVNGVVPGGIVTVEGINGGVNVYMQMAAWDRDLWGMSFLNVPPDQIGRTDVISYVLSYSFQPAFAPQFTQPAIIPIPEPSVWTLAALGTGVALVARFVRRTRSSSDMTLF